MPKNMKHSKRKSSNKQSTSKKRKSDAPAKVDANSAAGDLNSSLAGDLDTVTALSSGDMFVGAHVSAAGGVHNAVTNAAKIGCKAFALFLKSQQQWAAKPLEEMVIKDFKRLAKDYNYPSHLILPHGSYLINCGSPDPDVYEKSKNALLEEMKRCEQLGLTLFNFHPGSTCGKQSVEKSVQQIAAAINYTHRRTAGVTAGFDLTSKNGYDELWERFGSVIGWKYLKAMHLNDSKGQLGCHLDRHEKIGKGNIGQQAFKWIVNDKRLENIPLILETPDETNWETEIKLLYSLSA